MGGEEGIGKYRGEVTRRRLRCEVKRHVGLTLLTSGSQLREGVSLVC